MSGSVSATLTYDPLGRLKTIASGGATTQFLYEGNNLVAEYDGSGNLLRRYVPGGGMDQPLVWFEGSGVSASAMRWLHADERGSIIATTDNAGAATPYTYGPYGEPGGGAWSGSRYRYTGQIALPEVQLYHYKARVYDPNIGRFLQTDPIGYGDGMNMYAYVGNDPVNSVDPSGLKPALTRRPQPINPNEPPTNSDPITVPGDPCSRGFSCFAPDPRFFRDLVRLFDDGSGGLLPPMPTDDQETTVEEDANKITVTGKRPAPRPIFPWWIVRGSGLGAFIWVMTPEKLGVDDCTDPGAPGCRRVREPDPFGCLRNRDNEIRRCQRLELPGSSGRALCYANANTRYGECNDGGGLPAIKTPRYQRP